MARIRPSRGQGSSGDGAAPPPGGARVPRGGGSGGRRQGTPNPRPTPPPGSRRRGPSKAGTVTKAVAQKERRGSRFFSEVVAELRKVSWPDRPTLIQSTAVVLVVVAIVSVYLAALDAVFQRLVDAIF